MSTWLNKLLSEHLVRCHNLIHLVPLTPPHASTNTQTNQKTHIHGVLIISGLSVVFQGVWGALALKMCLMIIWHRVEVTHI